MASADLSALNSGTTNEETRRFRTMPDMHVVTVRFQILLPGPRKFLPVLWVEKQWVALLCVFPMSFVQFVLS